MTPIIGLFVAVVAGLVASSRREVLIGVVPPMLAATAAQSWYLGSGRGHNSPATTTDDPSYWVVQLIIVAIVAGVAIGICAIRARRVRRRGGSLVPVRREPGSWMLATAIVAGFTGTLALQFATGRIGNLAVIVVSSAVAVLAIAVFAVLWLRNRPVLSGADVRELAS